MDGQSSALLFIDLQREHSDEARPLRAPAALPFRQVPSKVMTTGAVMKLLKGEAT